MQTSEVSKFYVRYWIESFYKPQDHPNKALGRAYQ